MGDYVNGRDGGNAGRDDEADVAHLLSHSEGCCPEKPAKSDCKMTDMKSVGNTVTWAVTCPDAVSKGKVTYAGSTFDGTMETTVNQGGKKMQMKSKMKER